jgi:hypothetical protein
VTFVDLLSAGDRRRAHRTGNRWHAMGTLFAAHAAKTSTAKAGEPQIAKAAAGEACRRFGRSTRPARVRATSSYRFAREMVLKDVSDGCTPVVSRSGPARDPAPESDTVPEGWNSTSGWARAVAAFGRGGSTAGPASGDTERHAHRHGHAYTDQMQWVLGTESDGPRRFETSDIVWPTRRNNMSETAISGTFRCRYASGVNGRHLSAGAFQDRYIRYIVTRLDSGGRQTTSGPLIRPRSQRAAVRGRVVERRERAYHRFPAGDPQRRPTAGNRSRAPCAKHRGRDDHQCGGWAAH